VEILLWTLGAILALNVLVALWFTLWALLVRYRSPRRVAGAENVWRLATGPIGATRLGGIQPGPGGRLPPARDPDGIPIRSRPASLATSRVRRSRWGRRQVGIALAAAVLCAGTAFANPGARHVVAGALGAVVRGFQPDGSQQAGDADPAGDGSLLPGSGSPNSDVTPATGTDPRSAAGHGAAPATTGSAPGGADEPASPTTVAAVSGSSSHLDLTWADVAHESGYRIERSSDGKSGWAAVSTTGRNITTYRDTGLPSGTTFYYRVFATNRGVDSRPSDVASATTTVDPPSPAGVTAAAASSTQIDVTWIDVTGESGYRIERSSDGASGWVAIATTGQDVTSYTDAGLPPGTTFYYRVFATNGGDDSRPSDVSSASTIAGDDDLPTETGG
jgi:hypothetical protein